MQTTCEVFYVPIARGCVWSELRGDEDRQQDPPPNNADLPFVSLNDLPYCAAVSVVCCVPSNHHSLDTLELGAISTAQKANMCADALVLPVLIVIKIQPLGAVEKLTFLLHCFMAQH